MSPHLSDDRLIEICFDLDVNDSDRAHLQACTTCASRRSNLAGTLDDIGSAVTQEADEAFPLDRLARQRARIMQRVEQDGRPGRLIAFPAGHSHEIPRRVRPARWGTVAAAVAASFLVGLLAEHLAHDIPGRRQSMPVRTQVVASVTQVRAAIATPDDELLGQVELAGSGVGPAVLRPLDALTPRAWDAR
jgi:hypothetical protein